ncbi:MBOAT family O-acyltransferase [Roseivirga seohaensis]|uniref:MBOAT family O-acyltransferase n=1 Tax=Roseivirga seohaensis TaxID=1914963 RepID=UPI00288BD641|nr:MBOAT family O-acyltransferase [Roseivirga seohaensis]
MILVSSYIFYGWWDWRFLILIAFSTLVDFIVGIYLGRFQNLAKRKVLLYVSILVNLGLLFYFKYYGFFVENFVEAFSFLGKNISFDTLNIILPVGISFYTFQTLSYSIDVYKGKIQPTKDLVAFAAFVSFFPQLVAGPIERASNLLPQFSKKRSFDYHLAVDGVRQIFWGLFKKVVIADNCARYVNLIFDQPENYGGITLIVGSMLFAIQIYGDFSGYSDIAIGAARILGFNLKQNFAFPFFSKDFGEFWRRWHISLTTWFRDYVYIPMMVASKMNLRSIVFNVLVLFLVSGFWHGANWTFIVWGLVSALLYLPEVFLKDKRRSRSLEDGGLHPRIREFLLIFRTFSLFSLSLVVFRAQSINHAFQYFSAILSDSFLRFDLGIFGRNGVILAAFLLLFFTVEWSGRNGQHALEKLLLKWGIFKRYSFYYFIIFLILFYGGIPQDFIYFQF